MKARNKYMNHEYDNTEFKDAQTQQLDNINFTLMELLNQINRQNKLLDDIKFNTNVIGIILLIPFIIKVIIFLQDFFQTL